MMVGLVGLGGTRVLRGWARRLGSWSGRPWFCFGEEGFGGKGELPVLWGPQTHSSRTAADGQLS